MSDSGFRLNRAFAVLALALMIAAAPLFAGCMAKLPPSEETKSINDMESSESNGNQSAPPAEIDYGTPWYVPQLIFPPFVDYAHNACHASSIAEMPNGDLLAIWYASANGEGSEDQCIMSSRRTKSSDDPTGVSGLIWSTPAILHDTPDRPDGNAVLFVDKSGTVWLFFTIIGIEPHSIWYIQSKDNGVTWNEPTFVYTESGTWVRNKPITTWSGNIIVPIYSDTTKTCKFLVSLDNGTTWEPRGNVSTPKGCYQPTVVQLKNGSLLAYMRTGDKFIYETRSYDDGMTWTESRRTELQNPKCAIDMVLTKNGNLVLVFNDCQESRTPICAAISLDEGATWAGEKVLEELVGEWSYPAIIQRSDGMLEITYTFTRISIKNVELNEAYLLSDLPLNP